MSNSKTIDRIKTNLFSTEPKIVLKAIHEIKSKGNKNFIPVLFDFLLTNPEEEIRQEITQLLQTVKDKETAEAFVAALINEKYKSILKTILSACWQNGLDFSDHINTFIDLIIREDWEIAFEAFTVIDNLEHLPFEETRELARQKINENMATVSEQKKYFLAEISKIIA